jgi:hypothetical protein
MTLERIEELRQKLADPNIGQVTTLPNEEMGGLLDLAEQALKNREKTRLRVAALRQGQSSTKTPKSAQRGQKAAKNATKPEDWRIIENAATADAPNPVFAMLKSKLPSSVKHDPAATQFKTAKPRKP